MSVYTGIFLYKKLWREKNLLSKIKKAVGIADAKISFISLVDKAANERQFLITKNDDGSANFTISGKIIKKDDDNHYLTGVVYEPLVEDSQGNFMTAQEITKAAYWFAKNGDKVDLQHDFKECKSCIVVENWIAKADFDIGDNNVSKGTWLMTVEVCDTDIWDKVQKGEITGFSMGGVGQYSNEDVDINAVEKKSIIKQLAEAIGIPVEKAGKKMSSKNKQKLTEIVNSLNDFAKEVTQEYEEDNKVKKEDVQKMVDEAVAKASTLVNNGTSEIEVTAEIVQSMVDDAVEKAVVKANKPLPNEQNHDNQDIAHMIQEAVTKSLEPILKHKGLPNNLNNEQSQIEKDGQHFLAGII